MAHEEQCVDILPILGVMEEGKRVKHNAVFVLPCHKVDTGRGKVVRETSLLCMGELTSEAFSENSGPPQGQNPPKLDLPFDSDEFEKFSGASREIAITF